MATTDIADAGQQERGLNLEFTVQRALPTQAAKGADVITTLYADARVAEPDTPTIQETEVLAAALVFDAAYTGSGTDYVALTLETLAADGSGVTTVLTKNLTANIAAGVKTDLGIAVGGDNALDIPAGGSVRVKLHNVGSTGTAAPAGAIALELSRPTMF